MAFVEKMKSYLDKGVEASKDAFSKAGSAVQSFGDKSVVRIEKKQLEIKLQQEKLNLGILVYDILSGEDKITLSNDDSRVSGIIAEISRLKNEIEKRDEALVAESKKSD